MQINQNNINKIISKYETFVDEISKEYSYDNNIKHLLYLIVPSFIIYYGLENEKLILNVFKEVKIYYKESNNNFIHASFIQKLIKTDTFHVQKYINLNKYKDVGLSMLIDTLIHEYNHAINSYNNELKSDNDYIYLRTGICFLKYDKLSLNVLEKSKSTYLEEIINTYDTERIINIISTLNTYKIDNIEVSNILFTINKEFNNKEYKSNAYVFGRTICDELIRNKTFTPTICNLRLKGLIEDIPSLFDSVIGIENSYNKLNDLLEEVYILQSKYYKSYLFKKYYLNKIKIKSLEVINLIKEYDNNCIYKN